MATSLLFQGLQQSGSVVLQELHKAIAHEAMGSRKHSSGGCCCWCSSSTPGEGVASCDNPKSCRRSSNNGSSSDTACIAHRIRSLSHRMVAPSPPFHSPARSHLAHASSSASEPGSCGTANGSPAGHVEGLSSVSNAFAIDCASLASAVFTPALLPVLHGLWEQSNTRLCLTPRLKTEKETRQPKHVVWVEAWRLQPNEQLSNELRLWGNAALARSRPAAAEALYAAALMLLPASSSTSGGGSGNPLAVLHANRSLALFRLGKVAAALRAATEAAAASPMYSKAWYRRATALGCLRDIVERQFIPNGTSNSGSSREAADVCLRMIDLELTEARRMSQGDATTAVATAAAKRMSIGTCGCETNAACCTNSDATPLPCTPRHWLRGDVDVERNEKGWGLTCESNMKGTSEMDPYLVLEEEAFAVYVHPQHCANVPKIPFSQHILAQQSWPSEEPHSLRLHGDLGVRAEWEENVEAFKRNIENGHPSGGHGEMFLDTHDGLEGVCAGCATVPARGEASVGDEPPRCPGAWQALLHQLLMPTLPVVPCGSCAGAFFCCEPCKAASCHKRVCRDQQHDKSQACLNVISQYQIRAAEGAETEAFRADTLVQPLALSLQDPHRHIARQLLNSILPPSNSRPVPTAAATSPLRDIVGFGSRRVRTASEVRLVEEPAWYQLLRKTATVVLDSTRLSDWLLNATWLAGDAVAAGREKLCGGRCLVCSTVASDAPSSSRDSAAAEAGCPAAPQAPCRSEGTDVALVCSSCCRCCKAWCCNCSTGSSVFHAAGQQWDFPAFLPRCLYAAALHAYGVACCNSFTIRVACDPEEEATAAGTAIFLAASLINHSCTPNAIAHFGEPRFQQLHQHQERQGRWPPISQDGRLLPTPDRAIGRGTLLQVRLCGLEDFGKNRKKEICISYGPVVGLENSSWGYRQEWLLRHAGFYCRCEACEPPAGNPNAAGAGAIAFQHELLCGSPCPSCTSTSQVRKFLQAMQQSGEDTPGGDVLSGTVALFRRCFGPPLTGMVAPKSQKHQQQAHGAQSQGTSIYREMPAEATRLVMALSKLLIVDLARDRARQRWTTTGTVALLGHSCVRLWSVAADHCSEASAVIPSFLSIPVPLFECNEFRCLHCDSLFPAAAIEEEMPVIQSRLDRLRSTLGGLVTPSARISDKKRWESLTTVVQGIMQTIPYAVAASGCLSAQVWQVLQAAARASHAKADITRRLNGDASASMESACIAATCLSAGVHLLLQRLPLGAAQPEIYAHMYKAALLHGRAGDLMQAKQLLVAALRATQHSCGPYSVIHFSVKEYLEWLEQEHL